jgi:hypothetical protein
MHLVIAAGIIRLCQYHYSRRERGNSPRAGLWHREILAREYVCVVFFFVEGGEIGLGISVFFSVCMSVFIHVFYVCLCVLTT